MLLNREIHILQAELNVRGTIACALAGRFVREGECTSQVLAASIEDFRTCRACHHGQLLARSSGWPVQDLPLQAEFPAWAKRIPAAKQPPLDLELARPAREANAKDMVAKLIQALPQRPVVVAVDLAHGEDMTAEVAVAQNQDGSLEVISVRVKRPRAPRAPRAPKPVQAVLPIKTVPKPASPKPEAPPASTCRACGWLKPKTGTWPEPDLCNACAPATKPVRPKRLAKPRAPKPAVCANSQVETVPARPALDERLAKLAAVLRELTADGRMRVSMLDLVHGLEAANYDEAGALVEAAGLRTSRLYGPVQAVLVDHNMRQLLERAAESEVRQ